MKAVFLISYFALISAIGESKHVLGQLSDDSTLQRIVGGQPLQKNEFPWMVSLQKNGWHFCGATLISDEWAVTAAHCVDTRSPQSFELVCGAYSLTVIDPNEQRVAPKKIIVHEKWNKTVINDDIALIGLKNKMKMTESCQTISLPPDDLALNNGQECVATGWGFTKDKGKVSDLPQKVTLPLVSREDCQRNYQNTATKTKILKTNVCAGGSKGKGICSGDSGGPLNCKLNGKWAYSGLDSFTVPCALQGYPGVFTRVSEYNSWIRNKIV